LNRSALDQVELDSVQISYVQTLTRAVMNVGEDIRDLVRPLGPTPESNVYEFVDRMESPVCLQLEQCLHAAESVHVAVDGCPQTSARP
jgi:hypothetical protein